MLEFFQELEKKLVAKEPCMLALVIDSIGSVPRKAGAMMLVNSQGRCWGTIGGGFIEYNAILRGQELFKLQRTEVSHFDMTMRSNVMCGGAYDVLLYYLDFVDEQLCRAVQAIIEKAGKGQSFQLFFPLDGGLPLFKEVSYNSSLVEQDGITYFAQSFNTDGTVYIFGGGHVAQELVPVLAHLDFNCVVLDDREEFANRQVFPQAAEVMVVDYQELEKNIQLQANDYVLIMTRGHQCDTEVERFALRSHAKYIGLMGSRTKKALIRSMLTAEGFAQTDLDRVIIPIGLDIKSETPAEIAISIAAQLIETRAQGSNGANKYRV